MASKSWNQTTHSPSLIRAFFLPRDLLRNLSFPQRPADGLCHTGQIHRLTCKLTGWRILKIGFPERVKLYLLPLYVWLFEGTWHAKYYNLNQHVIIIATDNYAAKSMCNIKCNWKQGPNKSKFWLLPGKKHLENSFIITYINIWASAISFPLTSE